MLVRSVIYGMGFDFMRPFQSRASTRNSRAGLFCCRSLDARVNSDVFFITSFHRQSPVKFCAARLCGAFFYVPGERRMTSFPVFSNMYVPKNTADALSAVFWFFIIAFPYFCTLWATGRYAFETAC